MPQQQQSEFSAETTFQLLENCPRLSVEYIGNEDDGSAILSVINTETHDHWHLVVRELPKVR